ncbi:MAG: bifunctional glutamate N-acetyltransferase/amino-acid acetyltransferase ArgJ [Candidatus Omnitrophica bacterium]|nr:bifunctional glutamate N-acetyltransferase/amino-acid acetyltransferase ArgJ [Candidatus Omnitrophota bacterium]
MIKISLPKGFKVSGMHSGMKKTKKDIGLIFSQSKCVAAGVFTQNKVKAAPVILTQQILKKNEGINAVIVNSANANCCTGKQGMIDAKKMVQITSDCLNVGMNNVCVCSTGIIGHKMDMEKIIAAIPQLVDTLSYKKEAVLDFARSILTTDKDVKIKTISVNICGKKVMIIGVCKGAGMVHPKMATMLAYILTDANIEQKALTKVLKETNEVSFNAISVDGDMSTNDTVILLANAQAGNELIKTGTKEYDEFKSGLNVVLQKLAQDIVEDGEGSTKIVTITVKGTKTKKDAEKATRVIANSQLVKTSLYGQDPNWGRIASSVGASMIAGLDPDKMEIILDGVTFYNGKRIDVPAKKKAKVYKNKYVDIVVDVKAGKEEYSMFTCDLTKRYVEINAHYTT